MHWRKGRIVSETESLDQLADVAVSEVQPGMLVGLGAGKTAARAIALLGERARRDASFDVSVVAGSDLAESTCREAGLTVIDFATVEELDLLLDGADEIDRSLRVLKGSRGALTRERMLAWASRRTIYMVSDRKVTERIGTHATLAVAVMAFGLASTRAAIRRLGLNGVIRREMNGHMCLTDNGNLILDVSLEQIDDLEGLASEVSSIPGVVDHGLFLREADVVLIERGDGTIERLERP